MSTLLQHQQKHSTPLQHNTSERPATQHRCITNAKKRAAHHCNALLQCQQKSCGACKELYTTATPANRAAPSTPL